MTMQQGFSPAEALRTLHDLERIEESLTVRAFGITLMVFGLGAPAINMAYHLAAQWSVTEAQPWLFSFLWVPWIFGALLITSAIWHAQAVSMGNAYDGRSDWKLGAGLSLLYMVLLGAVTLWSFKLGPHMDPAVINLVVVGVFSLILAAFWHRTQRATRAHTMPQVLAGALLLAGGIAGAYVGLDGITATFVATFGTMAAWLTAGWVIQRRG